MTRERGHEARPLRAIIKDEREAAGLTQQEVADRIDCSVSKVIRMEKGTVGVAVNDLRAMLQLFGIHDGPRTRELLDLAREELRRRKTTPPVFVHVVTIEFETDEEYQAASMTNALAAALPEGTPHRVRMQSVRRYA